MENFTVKDAGSGESLSAAEREEVVQEAHAPEQTEPQQEEVQLPTNEDGDFVLNLDEPLNTEEDAVQVGETETLDVGERTTDSGEVESEVREQPQQEDAQQTSDAGFTLEAVTEDEPAQEEKEVIQEPIQEPVQEQPQITLPEGVDKLVDFMNETGGTLEDFINLNKDFTKMNNVDVLREYYKQTKPHFDKSDIDFHMDQKFLFDEETDDPNDIRAKKLAFKEELYKAQNHLASNRDKYYAELKANPRNLDPAVQQAMQFHEESQKQAEIAEKNIQNFHKMTEDVFNNDFKGFDFKIGDNKFRIKVGDAQKTMEAQKDLNNFIGNFIDESGQVKNVADYHKALYVARNADKMAQHFYEQGRADALRNNAAEAKNIDMKPRQDAAAIVSPSGDKFRVVSGESSNKLKIKMRG